MESEQFQYWRLNHELIPSLLDIRYTLNLLPKGARASQRLYLGITFKSFSDPSDS